MKNIFILCLVFAMTGCISGTKPSTFYLLDAIDAEAVKVRSPRVNVISINVNIPGYIDRPQIVTKGETNTEFIISEFNRWLESLNTTMQRVLAENISYQFPKSKVKPAFMGVIDPDFKVIVDVDKFDGRLGDIAELKVWWSLLNKQGDVIYFDDVYLDIPVGTTYADLVEKESVLLTNLSNLIAIQIDEQK